jgi:hypothetical protein
VRRLTCIVRRTLSSPQRGKIEQSLDDLEGEARRRAYEGVAEPVVSMGRVVEVVDAEGKKTPLFVPKYSKAHVAVTRRLLSFSRLPSGPSPTRGEPVPKSASPLGDGKRNLENIIVFIGLAGVLGGLGPDRAEPVQLVENNAVYTVPLLQGPGGTLGPGPSVTRSYSKRHPAGPDHRPTPWPVSRCLSAWVYPSWSHRCFRQKSWDRLPAGRGRSRRETGERK